MYSVFGTQVGGEASVSSSASMCDSVDDLLQRLSQMIIVERDDNDTVTAFVTVNTEICIHSDR